MNEHVRNNKYFSTAQEFRQTIDDFFDKKFPQIVYEVELMIISVS